MQAPQRRLRPRRIITRVIGLLLLGAIVNVAVAWILPNTLEERVHVMTTHADGSQETHLRPRETVRGWPCATMTSETPIGHGWVEIHAIRFGDFEFATAPIWPGFAINTLFYAAILWLLFLAPFQIRRAVRIKRGRCPKCGYPVGTSAVCTECGSSLDHHVDGKRNG